MSIKIRYNKELLESCVLRDKCVLEEEYNHLNRDIFIKYTCSCGKEGCYKKLYYIYLEGGAFCKDCLLKNKQIKRENTNIEKYGVDNPMKKEEFKEKLRLTNNRLYGVDNCFQNEKIKQKSKETCLKKYGVEHASKSENFRKKVKETCIKKYGLEHPMKSKEVKDKVTESIFKNTGYTHALKNPISLKKAKSTMLERYGVEHAMNKQEFIEKAKSSMIRRHGVEYCSQKHEFREKSKATMLERYGVEYNSQIPEVSEKQMKNSYKRKEVITPSGKTITMQGYEPQAYKILLETYNEDEILSSRIDVPTIWWFDDENKKHRYFVDFYIPKDNLMIEVKSERTFVTNKEKIEKSSKSCKEAGYKYELWVLNNKGEILNKIVG